MKVKMKLIDGCKPSHLWQVLRNGKLVKCEIYHVKDDFFLKIMSDRNKTLWKISKAQFLRYMEDAVQSKTVLIHKASVWHDKAIHETDTRLATFYGNVARCYLNKVKEL